MIDLGSWAETLGLKRKKTFVDRVQDVAEEVVDRAASAAGTLVSSVAPVIEHSRHSAKKGSKAGWSAVAPAIEKSGELARSGWSTVAPVLERSGDAALAGWKTTQTTASSGLSTAGDLAESAAATVASTAAATGDAAIGVATGIGGFVGALFRFLWWLVTLAIKTAILAGVAYAGWQWLESRRESQKWSAPTTGNSSGTYGSMSGTTGSTTPATAGAR